MMGCIKIIKLTFALSEDYFVCRKGQTCYMYGNVMTDVLITRYKIKHPRLTTHVKFMLQHCKTFRLILHSH